MRGIDVSSWDGFDGAKFQDHTEAAYRESDFVICKASQGTHYEYDRYRAVCDRVIADGKLLGLYHYAADSDNAEAEAEYFFDRFKYYKGRAIPFLDWESEQNAAWGSTTWALRFGQRFYELSGIWPGLYTGMDGARQCANCAQAMPLWFAGYPYAATDSWDLPPWPSSYSVAPWENYAIWQYTSDGGTDRNYTPLPAAWWQAYCDADEIVPDYRTEFMDVLRGWIGKNEADGSHREIVDAYNTANPLPVGYKLKYTDPWCAATPSAAAVKVGAQDRVPVECSCPRMIEKAQGMGIWIEDDAHVPEPGDLIMYDWQDDGVGDNTGNPDHVGTVENVDGNGLICVIEGNKNDAVERRYIQVNGRNIRGYVHPDWGGRYIAPSYPATTPAPSSGKIAEDGLWGTETTWALQAYLGTTTDGIVSCQRWAYKANGTLANCLSASWQWTSSGRSEVIAALQRLVGANDDGIAGPETVTKLQEYLGVDADGKCGPITVTALQRAINNKTL